MGGREGGGDGLYSFGAIMEDVTEVTSGANIHEILTTAAYLDAHGLKNNLFLGSKLNMGLTQGQG